MFDDLATDFERSVEGVKSLISLEEILCLVFRPEISSKFSSLCYS